MLEVGQHPAGELHIRKELTALKKARCLRDPTTCSSWRPPKSPVSARPPSCNGFTARNCAREKEEARELEEESKMIFSAVAEAETGERELLHNWKSNKGEVCGPVNVGDLCHLQSESNAALLTEEKMNLKQGRRDSRVLKKKVRNGRKASTAFPRNQEIQNSIRALSQMTLQEEEGSQKGHDTAFFRKNMLDTNFDCNSRSGSPLLVRDSSRSCQRDLKGSKRAHCLNHLKGTVRQREQSYTPSSTCSFSRNGDHSNSVIGSWDGTDFSDNDEMDEMDLRRHACGIPCYWSRTPKHRSSANGGSFSPSFSDSVRRRVSNIVSKNQSTSHKESHLSRKIANRLMNSRNEGLPLLTDGGEDRSLSEDGSSEDTVSDGRSNKLAELDMEASCKLDMRIKKRHTSQDQLELALTPGSMELTVYEDRHRSLSQKYRPKSFDELVGQNIVVQTLVSAILRSKIAPVYLFQGPRGTGKTSTARIFAAALNCLSPDNLRPCGFCRECIDLSSGRTVDVREVDATSSNGVEKAKSLLKNVAVAPSFSRFKVFIIDECHMLASETWTALLKILEEPPRHIVFILITTDSEKIPRTVVSRCQKYLFPKIKETEIVARLQRLAIQEGLDVDPEALEMIAGKSDGSLRDAETMLDQLSLLGQRITLSMVHELIGVVSNENLLELLELALSADTSRTVKRTRELLDSGIEPMALMSQLATVIMDILAGSFKLADVSCRVSYFHKHGLTDDQLDRLRRALKILSEAEKQLRFSSDQTTWLTAALLQFGGGRSLFLPTSAGTSVTQSPVVMTNQNYNSCLYIDSSSRLASSRQKHCGSLIDQSDSTGTQQFIQGDNTSTKRTKLKTHVNKEIQKHTSNSLPVSDSYKINGHIGIDTNNTLAQKEQDCLNTAKLSDIWRRSLEECKSNTLRQLLHTQARLLSVSIEESFAVVNIEFLHLDQKIKAEKHLKSIANAFQVALGCDTEVRMGVASFPMETENNRSRKGSSELLKISAVKQRDAVANTSAFETENDVLESDHRASQSESFKGSYDDTNNSFQLDPQIITSRIQEKAKLDAISDDQRLESAWLQEAEKCAPGLKDILKPEKHQVLPRDAVMIHHGIVHSGVDANVPLGVALQQNERPSNDQMKMPMAQRGNDSSKLRQIRTDSLTPHPGSLEEDYFATDLEDENLQSRKGSMEEKLVYFCGLCLVPSRKGSTKHIQ